MDQGFEGGVVMTTLHVPTSEDLIVLFDPERRPAGVLPWTGMFGMDNDRALDEWMSGWQVTDVSIDRIAVAESEHDVWVFGPVRTKR